MEKGKVVAEGVITFVGKPKGAVLILNGKKVKDKVWKELGNEQQDKKLSGLKFQEFVGLSGLEIPEGWHHERVRVTVERLS